MPRSEPPKTTAWDKRSLRTLDLKLWEFQVSVSSFDLANFIYHENGLWELLGDDAYTSLIDACIDCELTSEHGKADFDPIARQLHNRLFPRSCNCRHNFVQFRQQTQFQHRDTGDLVLIRLPYQNDDLTRFMQVTFRFGPDIDLMECTHCHDEWVRILDQEDLDQYLILLDPVTQEADLQIWINLQYPLDPVMRRSPVANVLVPPNLRQWQKDNNTTEKFDLYVGSNA